MAVFEVAIVYKEQTEHTFDFFLIITEVYYFIFKILPLPVYLFNIRGSERGGDGGRSPISTTREVTPFFIIKCLNLVSLVAYVHTVHIIMYMRIYNVSY